jgi:hypothetical protein
MWMHRASAAARDQHQRGLDCDRALPLTVAAFLRYKEGPVGAYDELLAMPNVLLRRRRLSLHVPFIAVDSEASIAGGRGNWALPKTLAEFEWHERDGLPRHIRAQARPGQRRPVCFGPGRACPCGCARSRLRSAPTAR